MRETLKNYLHKENVDKLIDMLDKEEQLYIQRYGNEIAFAVGVALEWLNTEVEGEKPETDKIDRGYKCCRCKVGIQWTHQYCHYCGTKIDWEGR